MRFTLNLVTSVAKTGECSLNFQAESYEINISLHDLRH